MSILNAIAHFVASLLYRTPRGIDVETISLTLGRMLAEKIKEKKEVESIREVEFKIFSQFGDDGIIQWLVNNLQFPYRTFIEFGVEDYVESNTRFLLMNNNWSGLVIDSSKANIRKIVNSNYYWRHEIFAKVAFIERENINSLISQVQFDKEIGILHVDLDGNDYWIWKEISSITPVVVILEYNSVFGVERSITVPYEKFFNRATAHYSNLFWGASLRALVNLSREKGYSFIGCNSAGNNAYFVRKDKLNGVVREVSLEEGFVVSRYRESRTQRGKLSYLAGNDRIEALRGLRVFNTDTERLEPV